MLSSISLKFFAGFFILFFVSITAVAEWKPAGDRILTKWAKDVNPDSVHSEYPRPMMVRENWLNLNGLWDYAILDRTAGVPEQYDGKILVPFPVESALSGVGKQVGDERALWYRRTFELPDDWAGGRVLLHFGAVDWETTVWINGSYVGEHKGGYDAFEFDISNFLVKRNPQEIVVAVWDPTDSGYQPRGKQVANPDGIWYTAVTGIWQTVWIEPAPESFIESFRITPDVDEEKLKVNVKVSGACKNCIVEATIESGGKKVSSAVSTDHELTVDVPDARLWSPDDPFLYDLSLEIVQNGKTLDKVSSYFGMRKIEVRKGSSDALRLFLNNKELFQFGPLDQGWWPDGLYTAPTDEALRHDIEIIKKLGFNMLRKHVKIEPARLYYWCDKLGVLVWQDMPSGDQYIGGDMPDVKREPHSARQFEQELRAMIDGRYNHPSIVMWVLFNEGWGQFDTARIVEWIKGYDPTRLVDNASGWTDRGVGDVHDIHNYPDPSMPPGDGKRASVLGEFGGLGLPVAGHTWQDEKNWGYVSYKNKEELTEAFLALVRNLKFLAWDGLSAAVYTQTSDVEIEVNGLMTYDRAVLKLDESRVAKANRGLYNPVSETIALMPNAKQGSHDWRYKMSAPGKEWYSPGYDDSTWKTGSGAFGSNETGNPLVRTKWKSPNIWLRGNFELTSITKNDLYFHVSSLQKCRIYLNGAPAAEIEGIRHYTYVPIEKNAREALQTGKNTVAVQCRMMSGGDALDLRNMQENFFDIGVVSISK
jgi:hypothetical protein